MIYFKFLLETCAIDVSKNKAASFLGVEVNSVFSAFLIFYGVSLRLGLDDVIKIEF